MIRHFYGPYCHVRIPPMFGLDSDICGAPATVRFTLQEDRSLQQFSCTDPAHRQRIREDMQEYGTVIEEDMWPWP